MWQNAKDRRLIKEQGRSARMRQAGLMCGFTHMNTLSGAAGTAYLQVNCVRGLGHVCTCRRDVRSALSTRFAGRRTGSRGMGNKRETLNRLKDVASEGHLCAFVCASVAPRPRGVGATPLRGGSGGRLMCTAAHHSPSSSLAVELIQFNAMISHSLRYFCSLNALDAMQPDFRPPNPYSPALV